MKRFGVLVVILCLSCSFAIVGLRRLWLVDDFDKERFSAFLSPSTICEAPCFADIPPGRITTNEALRNLDGHPWVGQTTITEDRFIEWAWNGSQPEFIDATGFGYADFSGGPVQAVLIPTTITYADLIISYGQPAHEYRTFIQFSEGKPVRVTAVYPSLGVMFMFQTDCPLSALYAERATLIYAPLPTEFRSMRSDVCGF